MNNQIRKTPYSYFVLRKWNYLLKFLNKCCFLVFLKTEGSKQKPLGRKRRDKVTSHGTGSREKVLSHRHDRWNRPRLPELPLILSTCSEFPGSPFRLCVHPNNRLLSPRAMRMSQPWNNQTCQWDLFVKFWSTRLASGKVLTKEAFLPLNERVLFFSDLTQSL